MRYPRTISLIKAIESRCTRACITPVSIVRGKRAGVSQGTFVSKALVYAYAMWIDPEFNLDVIEAFDRSSGEQKDLWKQLQSLISREVNSQVRASFGSNLMLIRKREKPKLLTEREQLEAAIQPSLLN